LEQKLSPWDLNDRGSSAYQVFLSAAVKQERDRSDFIERQMDQAKQMDTLVERTKRPAVNCLVCGMLMQEDGHAFRNDNREIAFFFQCPAGHFSKRLVHADGKREISFKIKRCANCGGGINSTTEETELELIFTDTCTRCVDVQRLEMSMDRPAPIDEQERKKYCTDFIGQKTQLEELSGLLEVIAEMNELSGQEVNPGKTKIAIKLEQVNIADLESRVTACLEKAGFIKVIFQVSRPEAQVLIDFSLQYPLSVLNQPVSACLKNK
jgi:hypothetical protein